MMVTRTDEELSDTKWHQRGSNARAPVHQPGCSCSCHIFDRSLDLESSNFKLFGDVVVLLLRQRWVGPERGERAEGAAGEQDNAFQSPVVEEEVEGPEGSVFAERVRLEIRIVRVDVALGERDFLIDGGPQLVVHSRVLISRSHREQRVHRVHDVLKSRIGSWLNEFELDPMGGICSRKGWLYLNKLGKLSYLVKTQLLIAIWSQEISNELA